jgi:hypothetical protein
VSNSPTRYDILLHDALSQIDAAKEIGRLIERSARAMHEKFKRLRDASYPSISDVQEILEEADNLEQLSGFVIEAVRDGVSSLSRVVKLRPDVNPVLQEGYDYLAVAVDVGKSFSKLKRSMSAWAGCFD